jgi:hypothetical protein
MYSASAREGGNLLPGENPEAKVTFFLHGSIGRTGGESVYAGSLSYGCAERPGSGLLREG